MTAALAFTPTAPKVGDALSVQGSGFSNVATLTTALTGTNNDIKLTAVARGTAGNAAHLVLLDPSGNNAALSITVSGAVVTAHLATGSGGAITTTAAQLLVALAASAPATALFTAALATGNDGTGVVTALTSTALTGGTDDTVELEIIHSSDAQDDLRNSFVTASGAFDSTSDYTYTLETDGSVTAKARVSGVVVAEAEVEVFTRA